MAQFFVIVCMGRTGSTMLVHLLNSHSEIECRHELFHPQIGAFKDHPCQDQSEYIEKHAYETSLPIRGFKMPHSWIRQRPDVFDDFRRLNYKVVMLSRRDAIKHYLSLQLVYANNDWHPLREYQTQRIRLDPADFLKFVRLRENAYAEMTSLCTGLDRLNVAYEDVLRPDTQRELCTFLGATGFDSLQTATIKRRTKPACEVIENYDEILQVLRGVKPSK